VPVPESNAEVSRTLCMDTLVKSQLKIEKEKLKTEN
jgi:hypothetical protein